MQVSKFRLAFCLFFLINKNGNSYDSTGFSFKFILKVVIEESIVNAPIVRLQSKNTNNAKVRLALYSSMPTLEINLNEHQANLVWRDLTFL
jgi:hypothetical protein